MAEPEQKPLVVIIECPSGGRLEIPRGVFQVPDDKVIPTVMNHHMLEALATNGRWLVDPIPADFDLWRQQFNPRPHRLWSFVIRVQPVAPMPLAAQDFLQAMLDIRSRAVAKHDNLPQLLDELILGFKGLFPSPTAAAAVPASDGWGHSLEDSSVEGLLRELAASDAGTDKHETVLKQIVGGDGEKLVLYHLLEEFMAFRKETTRRLNAIDTYCATLATHGSEQRRIMERLRGAFEPEREDMDLD